MSSLTVESLQKQFGKVNALKDVSFSVGEGEFMVMLGPTAAGKTTTLRCIAGLEKPDGGAVKMDGQAVTQLSPAERDVALVFQTYALYPRKTAYQNMAFPLQARDYSNQQIDIRVREVAKLLHISELLDRRPAQMSGGQQQRVALGRAMVRQPRMFLMDEPLTNLDFKLRVEMRAELKRIQRELATTFFYVTNDQVEAMSMADRIAVLNKGVLQQVGTPEAIYDHPANLFVAQFIGNPRMNTLPCTLDVSNGVICGAGDAWQVTLNAAQRDQLRGVKVGSQHLFGVRAEDVTLHREGGAGRMAGSVYIVEPLGDRTYVDIEVGGSMVKARTDADFSANVGDTLYLTFDTDRIHLFDADSETTIF